MQVPCGYRLMNCGEFIPGNAIYFSIEGVWKPTPCAGKMYIPASDGIFACFIHQPGTRIGSESVSDSSAAYDAPPYGFPSTVG